MHPGFQVGPQHRSHRDWRHLPRRLRVHQLLRPAELRGPRGGGRRSPTNKCIITYNDHDSATPTGSVIYSCNGGKQKLAVSPSPHCPNHASNNFLFSYADTFFTTPYTDTQCTVPGLAFTQSLACSNAQANNYASGQGFCNKDPTVIPVPGAAFTTEVNFGSPSSCQSTDFIDTFKSYGVRTTCACLCVI